MRYDWILGLIRERPYLLLDVLRKDEREASQTGQQPISVSLICPFGGEAISVRCYSSSSSSAVVMGVWWPLRLTCQPLDAHLLACVRSLLLLLSPTPQNTVVPTHFVSNVLPQLASVMVLDVTSSARSATSYL